MGIDFVPTGINTGVSGAMTGNPVINTIPQSSAVVLAAGLYVLYAVGANVSYQVQDNNLAWQNVLAVGVGGLICSDGTNFRLNNANAGASQTATTIKIG